MSTKANGSSNGTGNATTTTATATTSANGIPANGSTPTTTKPAANATTTPQLSGKAIFYMVLLALQFGIQPILTRKYAPTGINRSAVVMMQEIVKFVIALLILYVTGALNSALKEWSFHSWLTVAMVPASLYTVQNMAALMAYQNLDALTFNVLNQTKTLSAALCCYLVMGSKQSGMQVIALMLLFLSALVMEGIVPVDSVIASLTGTSTSEDEKLLKPEESQQDMDDKAAFNAHRFTYGIIPIMIASFISGLAGAVTQKSLQAATGARDSYMFSMELCVATVLILLVSLTVSPDGAQLLEHGYFQNWTVWTWIPIFTNACGGVLVGLVTKYAGSVSKGFALIFGMCLSGVMQAQLQPDVGVSGGQIVGGILAAISLYLHSTYPPGAAAKKKPIKQD